ncbi:hypothetical protein ACFXDE_31030 [Kitasatospora sp. NPDC059408]|uniref:hypothetical protein n=1 Tax=Kitasatospora sp. NPDC059408 TaxID=3346823 RepID=UPI00367E986A
MIQTGSIHGDINITTAASSADAGPTDEDLAEGLRKSTWRARFSCVDFVNLPRIPMLSDGAAVLGAARRAGLDVAAPLFLRQGLAAGLFVRLVKPVFETWGTEATALCESTIERVHPGMMVSFEARVRCRNAPKSPPRELTGVPEQDPHLFFRIGERSVLISFDPRWLTTSTASGTLHDAARHPLEYSGLGLVRSVSEDGQVRVSALVFGQPQTPAQAQFKYAKESTLRSPAGLTEADFRNEFAANNREAPRPASPQERKTVNRLDVTLFFDEDKLLFPGHLQREVMTQLVRVVPEYRRDVGVAVASLVVYGVLGRGVRPADIAAHILAREPGLWKTFTVPGLTTLVDSVNLAVATVTGMGQEQVRDLHEVMQAEVPSYLGGVELDRSLPMHRRLLPEQDQFHVVGAELRLKYSAESRYIAQTNGDDLDEPLDEWRERGLFRSVVWEEDVARSTAEEQAAASLLRAWRNAQSE